MTELDRLRLENIDLKDKVDTAVSVVVALVGLASDQDAVMQCVFAAMEKSHPEIANSARSCSERWAEFLAAYNAAKALGEHQTIPPNFTRN